MAFRIRDPRPGLRFKPFQSVYTKLTYTNFFRFSLFPIFSTVSNYFRSESLSIIFRWMRPWDTVTVKAVQSPFAPNLPIPRRFVAIAVHTNS